MELKWDEEKKAKIKEERKKNKRNRDKERKWRLTEIEMDHKLDNFV